MRVSGEHGRTPWFNGAVAEGVDEKLSQAGRTMRGMKRIVPEIELEEDSNVVTWRLDDWRGQVSAGVSVDTSDNLVHMWGGDIEHVMDEVRGQVELSGLFEQ